jgi:hypothetical protein
VTGSAAAARRAALGAALAAGALHALSAAPPGGPERWARRNHRGREVSLLSGPALAVASCASSGLPLPAAAVAGLGAAAVGGYDDAVGSRDGARAKGFRGHLAALRAGRVTAGQVKLVGIGACGVGAVVALPPRGGRTPLDVAAGGAVVAGSANLLNLLDLRPGRALKAGAAAAGALGLAGPAAAALALLPGDLRERTMLGDSGANGLGALLGLALVDRLGRRGRWGALLVLAALNAASEVVSFSRVIDAVPPLRWADRLGRLP